MASEQTCPGCGESVWPALEMTVGGGFDAKCPRQECGAVIPNQEPERQANVVALKSKTSPGNALSVGRDSDSALIGDAELQYIRAVLASCQQMDDAKQIKQRLQRLSALLQ